MDRLEQITTSTF